MKIVLRFSLYKKFVQDRPLQCFSSGKLWASSENFLNRAGTQNKAWLFKLIAVGRWLKRKALWRMQVRVDILWYRSLTVQRGS
jgi:hypothetical protein